MSNEAKIKISAEDKTSAAFASISRSADKLGFNLDTLKGGAIAALGALAVPVSAGAFVTLANESRKAIDDLGDLAETVGSTVEKISAIDGLNREVGGSFDVLSTALVKFNGILNDADPDKGAGAVLKALNLDIEELKRLDPVDAMQRVAVALGQWADDGNRARAVQELFGKSVKDIAPLMRDLAEAQKLQARVTTEQREEVDRFNKELAKLGAASTDAGRAMTISVITVLNTMIDRFREAEKAKKGLFSGYWGGVAGFYEGIGLKDPPAPGKSRYSSGSIIDPSDPRAALRRMEREQDTRPSLQIPDAPKPTTRTGGAGAPKDPYAEGNRYLESLRKQLQATEELSVYEKLLADIRDGSIGKLNTQLQAQLEATAKQIDADRELNAITKEFAELNAKAKADQAALAAEGARIWEETRTPLERLNIEQAKLQHLLDKGKISFDTFARASLDLEESLRSGPNKAISELDQFTQRAAQNMQDYLGSSFQQIMEGNFDNIGDAFIAMLNNMVAQAAAAQLAEHLLGKYATGKGDGTGLLGSALTSLANFAGFKAEGGPVQAGKGYIVGERGPEWFEPASSGTVVPNHALGGQTVHVSNNFSFSSPVDRRTQQQVAAAAGRGVQLAMSRNG